MSNIFIKWRKAIGFLNFNPLNRLYSNKGLDAKESLLDNLIKNRYHTGESWDDCGASLPDMAMIENNLYYVELANKLGVLKDIHVTPLVMAGIIQEIRRNAGLTYSVSCSLPNEAIFKGITDIIQKYKMKLIHSEILYDIDVKTGKQLSYKFYTISVKHPDYKRRITINIFLYYENANGFLSSTVHTAISSIKYYSQL